VIYVVLRVEHIPPVAPRLGLAMFVSPSCDCVCEGTRYTDKRGLVVAHLKVTRWSVGLKISEEGTCVH